MPKRLITTSKFLSLILRHRPEVVGLTLDEGGWVAIDTLLDACAQAGKPLSRERLLEVVAQNDKQRFVIRNGRIRANQGHSVKIELGLQPVPPPERLYHGTAAKNQAAILRSGLKKMKRHKVHLSHDEETARRVGMRHGKPVVFTVDTGSMHRDGHRFFRSENGVWLTDHVPSRYLQDVTNPVS